MGTNLDTDVIFYTREEYLEFREKALKDFLQRYESLVEPKQGTLCKVFCIIWSF